jgi:hypothetical protein
VSALAIGEGLNADHPENSSSRKRQRLHEEDEEKDENQSSECSKRVNSQTTVVKNYYFNL